MSAAADHIDNFEVGPFLLTVSSSGPFISADSQPIAISGGANGGTRTVMSLFFGGTGAATASLSPDGVGGFDDSFVFGVDSGASALLQFDYAPVDADFLNIPAMLAQWDRLSLDYITNRSGIASVLVNSNGNVATATASYTPGSNTLDFLFSSFTGMPIDFTDIDGVMLYIPLAGGGSGPGSFSGSLFYRNGSVAVPEAGSLAGLFAASAVLALRRRRAV
jgi:hypothetical protein